MIRILLAAWLLFLGPLERLDWALQQQVQGLRRPALEGPMHAATRVGRPVNVLGALLGIAILDTAAGPATAALVLVSLAPTNLLVEGLKRWVDRTRPDGEHKPSNASFPSSHAANGFALAAVLARRWRRGAAAFWVAAAIVAFSRVYLNRHFLSDVAVGALIGMLCAWAVCRWLGPWIERRLARRA